jgi:hypothetical protein
VKAALSNAHLRRCSSPRVIPTYDGVRLHAPVFERLAPETFYSRPERRTTPAARLRATTLARLRGPVLSTGGEAFYSPPVHPARLNTLDSRLCLSPSSFMSLFIIHNSTFNIRIPGPPSSILHPPSVFQLPSHALRVIVSPLIAHCFPLSTVLCSPLPSVSAGGAR